MRAALPLSYFYRPKPLPAQTQAAPQAMPKQQDPVEAVLQLAKAKLGQTAVSDLAGSGATSTAGTSMAELGGTGATNGLPAAADMGATPIAIPAVAAISAVLAGKAGLDMLKGKTPKGPAGQFGRGTLAVASGGLSEAGNKIKKFAGFGRGNSHLEDQKRAKLAERGINLTGENDWESNPEFHDTRNEKYLKGKNIVNAATMYDIPGYENASDQARLEVADELLRRNAFREHNGGGEADISDPELQKFISQRIHDPRNDVAPLAFKGPLMIKRAPQGK